MQSRCSEFVCPFPSQLTSRRHLHLLTGFREEASFMPSCMFDKLCTQHTNVKQLQIHVSQNWLQSWHRWLHVQDMLTLYDDNQKMKKHQCKDIVVAIASISLMQMFVSFPSDEQCRCQLRSDGFICCDMDGVDHNCFVESVLQLFLLNKMIKMSTCGWQCLPMEAWSIWRC